MTGKRRIRQSQDDRLFDIINTLLCIFVFIVVLYPLIFVVSASFSDPLAVLSGKVKLLPVDITLDSYKKIFDYKQVLTGYKNSLILLFFGTALNVVLTIMAAYPLSRRDLYGRRLLTALFTFTMFFSGGLIPTYFVVRDLGLYDTLGAMIIPIAINMYNVIITRTYFENSIPESLIEAAYIDGANNLATLRFIVLPMSKAIIAIICLYYGVGHWNQYFQALIYISDSAKYPLQVVLREILLQSQVQDLVDTVGFEKQLLQAEGIKYSLIIVASVPVLAIYPFVQRYFVKGVMIGAVKG